MTIITKNPAERNSAIIALILQHLAEAKQPLEYTVLTDIVREDTGLTDIQVGGTITSALFALISGGLVKNTWHDEKRNKTALGLGAMLSLSPSAKVLMAQTDGVEANPDDPVHDSHETDELIDRLGELAINVLNFPDSGHCFLSFSFRPDSEITEDNLAAAKDLIRRFDEDDAVRQSIIDVELSDGGGYVVSTDCDLGFRTIAAETGSDLSR